MNKHEILHLQDGVASELQLGRTSRSQEASTAARILLVTSPDGRSTSVLLSFSMKWDEKRPLE